jgi:RNA polymerase sigma-70 factor (ECF subfamily)
MMGKLLVFDPARTGSRALGAAKPSSPEKGADSAPDAERRIRDAFEAHYDFIWRLLRRFGVAHGSADDAAQQVFLTLAPRIADVEIGKERPFLFGVAVRVASDQRKAAQRERLGRDRLGGEPSIQAPQPDEVLDRARAKEILHQLLDELDDDLRTVFVLSEIEHCTAPEIAELLVIPVGTVSSRLRRARESFDEALRRFRARVQHRANAGGGEP